MMQKDYTKIQAKFGEHLKKLRRSKNLSLREMSYNCELDSSNISKIEHGKFNVGLATIIELAKGLSIPPKELLNFEVD